MSTLVPHTGMKSSIPLFLLPIEGELRRVEELLRAELSSAVQTVAAASRHILDAGGKRLRPSLVLLSAHACRGGFDCERAARIAASTELIHMATLMHDDVIDGSDSRRGRTTPNAIWGNQVSVLTGDYMLAKAFSLLAPDGDTGITQALSCATVAMAEGEISQIESRGDWSAPAERYLSIIRDKTASFMSACCRIGAILAGGYQPAVEGLAQYGLNLGMAFQITDDLLDLVGDPVQTGKPVGADIREGKLTMPLILVLETAGTADRAALEQIIRGGAASEDIEFVQKLAVQTGAVGGTRETAAQYIEQAVEHLEALPASEARNCLEELARHVLQRER